MDDANRKERNCLQILFDADRRADQNGVELKDVNSKELLHNENNMDDANRKE